MTPLRKSLGGATVAAVFTYSLCAYAEPSLPTHGGADQVDAVDDARPDPLFPTAGRPSITVGGGIPFLALGEIAVGVSDSFAVGAVAGLSDTIDEVGVGLRPRFRLAHGDRFDVALALPVLFYPPSEKRAGMSWLLMNPALFGRAHIKSGPTIYGGVGAVLTTCPNDFASAFSDATAHEPHDDSGDGGLNGAWNTFHAGASLPVSARFSVFLDTMATMAGFKPAKSYGDKIGPPLLAQLGANFSM